MKSIEDILVDLGYKLNSISAKEWRCKPLYRESDNNSSLKICKNTGRFFDFSASISGTLEDLIKLTLNLPSTSDAKGWLNTKHSFVLSEQTKAKPSIKLTKIISNAILEELEPNHSYWVNRGISLETISSFNGGVSKQGKMSNRYVFPIFNSKKEIIGLTARQLVNNPKYPKWLHSKGDRSNWLYPLFLNYSLIKEKKEVILVESIGDLLSLYEAGIKNVMVVFGIKLSIPMLNCLLKIDSKVIIALNNDADNNLVGNVAAEKMEKTLLKYLDREQVRVKLPIKNDFGDMNKEEITNWYASS